MNGCPSHGTNVYGNARADFDTHVTLEHSFTLCLVRSKDVLNLDILNPKDSSSRDLRPEVAYGYLEFT